MKSRVLRQVIIAWLPVAAAISVMSLLVVVTVQQNFRMTANDPQIQVAQDMARQFEAGSAAGLSGPPVDIASSLALWTAVYDKNGRPIDGTGRLDGALPRLPTGVFESASARGEARLTWMPRDGVRSATVTTAFGGAHPGYVVAGRSLREIETREDALNLYALAAWALALVVTFALMWLPKLGRHLPATRGA